MEETEIAARSLQKSPGKMPMYHIYTHSAALLLDISVGNVKMAPVIQKLLLNQETSLKGHSIPESQTRCPLITSIFFDKMLF
jgi:hypothetical protein